MSERLNEVQIKAIEDAIDEHQEALFQTDRFLSDTVDFEQRRPYRSDHSDYSLVRVGLKIAMGDFKAYEERSFNLGRIDLKRVADKFAGKVEEQSDFGGLKNE